ncbi:uncharacterized protein LOC9642913 [Selaginella moellendorffii]|uniref:uncharacterized protein LOC9642913 n=1 Tax=Selaginella moellendorffii TaxID=88036 RepID=UPI000D1C9A4A|nr:uncharacterized protein LOC9642913 [Selaginella moellendorffii]|eukprot:XP_024516558.1 uncharacterized protein LOC9642913 [Selaginella moellendorffii]
MGLGIGLWSTRLCEELGRSMVAKACRIFPRRHCPHRRCYRCSWLGDGSRWKPICTSCWFTIQMDTSSYTETPRRSLACLPPSYSSFLRDISTATSRKLSTLTSRASTTPPSSPTASMKCNQ